VHQEFRNFGGSYETFASYFSIEMSPQHIHDSTASNFRAQAGNRGVAALISQSRSEYRKGFCASVVAKATDILQEIEQDPGWKFIFHKAGEDHSQGSDEVRRPEYVPLQAYTEIR